MSTAFVSLIVFNREVIYHTGNWRKNFLWSSYKMQLQKKVNGGWNGGDDDDVQ